MTNTKVGKLKRYSPLFRTMSFFNLEKYPFLHLRTFITAAYLRYKYRLVRIAINLFALQRRNLCKAFRFVSRHLYYSA